MPASFCCLRLQSRERFVALARCGQDDYDIIDLVLNRLRTVEYFKKSEQDGPFELRDLVLCYRYRGVPTVEGYNRAQLRAHELGSLEDSVLESQM